LLDSLLQEKLAKLLDRVNYKNSNKIDKIKF